MAENITENTADQDSRSQPTIQVSRRLLRNYLRKLRIHDGDILAVRAGTLLAKTDILHEIAGGLKLLDKEGKVLVIVLDDFNDLSILDEREMNKHGWFRVQALRRVLRAPGGIAPVPQPVEEAHEDIV